MGDRRPTPVSVDAYVSSLPAAARQRLEEIRATIREAAPHAREVVSYGIGAFALEGSPFVFFAGFDRHVSVYPVFKGNSELDAVVGPYLSGKATARFRVDGPVPAEVVAAIARANLERAAARLRKRKPGKKEAEP